LSFDVTEPNAGDAAITGGGHYSLAGLNGQFSVSAVLHADGSVSGQFHHFLDEGGGITVDVNGSVTCLAIDPIEHRGWIGGIVTSNRSTDPDFQTDIQQPGRDIWFRVLDGGQSGHPDRTTFTGFAGSAGIPTSADYCAIRPWPADNARTWPVTEGQVTVHS
jgi:hypothetical protein